MATTILIIRLRRKAIRNTENDKVQQKYFIPHIRFEHLDKELQQFNSTLNFNMLHQQTHGRYRHNTEDKYKKIIEHYQNSNKQIS